MSKKLGILLIVITISLMVTISIAVSYAMWTVTNEQEESNIVQSGCFSMELTNETNVINLNNAYPILDEEADALIPYTFTITNTCTIASSYNINLEILNGTTLNTSYVATKIDGEIIRKLNALPNGEKQIENSLESKTIVSGRLAPNESKSYNLRLWMDKDVTLSSNAENKELKVKLVIESVTSKILCQRAKNLHTETCSQTDDTLTCSAPESIGNGTIITYGNLGTVGELNVGDAFTCDVNGDGIYNEENERFYYVSDLYTGGEDGSETYDANTAVLIYYSNVFGGIPSNVVSYAYNTNDTNILGPITAVEQLPSKSQWSNVSLKNEVRQIRTEIGTTTTEKGNIKEYVYSGKTSRLITYQEIKHACNSPLNTTGSLDIPQCRFLLENLSYSTDGNKFGYWLETPISYSDVSLWFVNGSYRSISYHSSSNSINLAARPVIEVAKTDMDI